MNIGQLHLSFCKVFNYIFEEYINFKWRFDERLYRITHGVTFSKLESKLKVVFFNFLLEFILEVRSFTKRKNEITIQ